MKMQNVDWADLMQRLVKDTEFREGIRSDPRGTLKRYSVEIPGSVDVEVHEDDASTVHSILPVKGDERQLELVREANPITAKVWEAAWTDPGFKKRLFSEPREAIKDLTNLAAPESMKLIPLENTNDRLHIVLPYLAPATGELSDAELEMVAGGKSEEAVEEACDTAMESGMNCVGRGEEFLTGLAVSAVGLLIGITSCIVSACKTG
jgi:hypothetical protein